jgi:hypothetical protein
MCALVARAALQVGDLVPDVPLYQTSEAQVSLRTLCGDQRVVILGIPGAFTPTCSTVGLCLCLCVCVPVCLCRKGRHAALSWGVSAEARAGLHSRL